MPLEDLRIQNRDLGDRILGSVKLPEGPSITAEILDCPEESIKIGMPMELLVTVGGKDKEGNEVVVYKFRPKSG